MEPPRVNLYILAHKAVRSLMFDAAATVARTDFSRPRQCSEAVATVRLMMEFLGEHLEIENRFVQPAIAARAPAEASALEGDHTELKAIEGRINDQLLRLEHDDPEQRPMIGKQLYLDLNALVARHLRHLNEEETVGNAALWAHYTDPELLEILGKAQGSIPPGRFASWMELMLPAMNHAERCMMFAGIKAKAPPVVVDNVLRMARRVLTPGDYEAFIDKVGSA